MIANRAWFIRGALGGLIRWWHLKTASSSIEWRKQAPTEQNTTCLSLLLKKLISREDKENLSNSSKLEQQNQLNRDYVSIYVCVYKDSRWGTDEIWLEKHYIVLNTSSQSNGFNVAGGETSRLGWTRLLSEAVLGEVGVQPWELT